MEDKEDPNKEQDSQTLDEQPAEQSEQSEQAESSPSSDSLQQIKDAYEARLRKVEDEAAKAKSKYESDLDERNKMIAQLIGQDGGDAPVPDRFKEILKRRENNKRY